MLADKFENRWSYTVQVRQRGQMTIPQKVRAALSIEDGDTLTLVQIGDAFVLTPKPLKSPKYATEFSSLMSEKGLSLADLLQDLPQIREEIYNERYGDEPS